MSRSNRKIKTLFRLWAWLKKEATMDAVIEDDGPIPTTRWVPLRDENGEVEMRVSKWGGGNEYPVMTQQDIPVHELKADLARYVYQLQYIPPFERDERGLSLVKKAKMESKAAGKREIAQQLQEEIEETEWEKLVKENRRALLRRIEKETVKSWEDKRFYDLYPSRYDFWERCDPSEGCDICGGEDDPFWDLSHPRAVLENPDGLWDDCRGCNDLDYCEDCPVAQAAFYDRTGYANRQELAFWANSPSNTQMWQEHEAEEAEITRCNKYIDKMGLDIDMMWLEAELEAFDSDWNNFFPGHKEPLEDTEKRRLVHAERRRRTYIPR